MTQDKPMLIRRSPLTGEIYAFQHYKTEGTALVVTGKKHDVTQEVKNLFNPPGEGMIAGTFCTVCGDPIPIQRAMKRSNTCKKECAQKLRKFHRAEADKRKCRFCNRPSSPEDRKKFTQWHRQQPDYQPKKRGRPNKTMKADTPELDQITAK